MTHELEETCSERYHNKAIYLKHSVDSLIVLQETFRSMVAEYRRSEKVLREKIQVSSSVAHHHLFLFLLVDFTVAYKMGKLG